jgi:hypothetical protein
VKQCGVERDLKAAQLARARLHACRRPELVRGCLHELDAPARSLDRARHLRSRGACDGSGDGVGAQVESEHLVPVVCGEPVRVVARAAAAVEDDSACRAKGARLRGVAHGGLRQAEEVPRHVVLVIPQRLEVRGRQHLGVDPYRPL